MDGEQKIVGYATCAVCRNRVDACTCEPAKSIEVIGLTHFGAQCKGSWTLGSACGQCSRCAKEAFSLVPELLAKAKVTQERADELSAIVACVAAFTLDVDTGRDSLLERSAALLWRRENPTMSVFACDGEMQESYRERVRNAIMDTMPR